MAQPNYQLKEPVFDAVSVGERIMPRRIVVDERYVRQAMFAFDDYRRWPSQGIDDLVPTLSAMVLRDLHLLIGYTYDPARMMGLHQREEVWFKGPVRLGQEIELTGVFTDKFERRQKGYVVYEAEARDVGTGELLVRQLCTEIMRVPAGLTPGTGSSGNDGRRVRGVWPADRPVISKARQDIAIGSPIAPLRKQAHQDQMSVFSGCDMQWSNIHTDRDRARAGGYRDTLVAGLMGTCWMTEMLSEFFGAQWLSTGTIECVYLKPVFRNDILTSRAVVIGSSVVDGISRLELEVWAENQDREMVAAGWASAAAP